MTDDDDVENLAKKVGWAQVLTGPIEREPVEIQWDKPSAPGQGRVGEADAAGNNQHT